MILPRFLLVLPLLLAMCGCSYLESTLKQTHLSMLRKQAPTQRLYKHMLETDNFFVFGKVENGKALNEEATAVIAVSDLYQKSEMVDISHFSRINSYYGLTLPAGNYQLLVVSDLNRDGYFDATEVVGGKTVTLNLDQIPAKVLGDFNIDLDTPFVFRSTITFRTEVRQPEALAESLFFPKGSIRNLDDEIFSRRMASLGMYEPAAFLEEAPMMFYAMEEDQGYKVPVVFVHGIDGSARDFADIVANLDRSRYRPWFFHYPSGNDLSQLSEMFYNIFLSGNTVNLGTVMPMVIVAHSMGGLVVRDALSRRSGKEKETKVTRLITIASPLGGHPAAAMASQAPVVIPSWRDVDPNSQFMRHLRRQKLPDGLEFHLLYAYGNENTVKLGENSDGVVPLSSQLSPHAQNESTAQFGFNDTHTGILNNADAIKRIVAIIETVRPPYPDDHINELIKGGYKIPLGDDYSPLGKYCIHNIGHWLEALAAGRIQPIDPIHSHFVRVIQGVEGPDTPVEKDWMRFIKEYPQRDGL
ncbi:MAG: DUF413 domain-containing protein [Desulforhopalus sp.]|nr:DUF413 domain-containing protein [Desulforhopalus sp.]